MGSNGGAECWTVKGGRATLSSGQMKMAPRACRVVKAGRAAARRFLCGGQQIAGVHTRCWAPLQRAMTAKRADVRLAESSEFSRGVLTLHHGSGSQSFGLGASRAFGGRSRIGRAAAELDHDAESSKAGV